MFSPYLPLSDKFASLTARRRRAVLAGGSVFKPRSGLLLCLRFFLTARPWAERGSCSTLDLFLFYFFRVERPRSPLGRTKDSRESPLFSLLCLKYIFFWFYQSVRFEAKERIRTCKDYVN